MKTPMEVTTQTCGLVPGDLGGGGVFSGVHLSLKQTWVEVIQKIPPSPTTKENIIKNVFVNVFETPDPSH